MNIHTVSFVNFVLCATEKPCGYLAKYNREGSGRKTRKASKKGKSTAKEVTAEASMSRPMASTSKKMVCLFLFLYHFTKVLAYHGWTHMLE